jgi:hypothetical protein
MPIEYGFKAAIFYFSAPHIPVLYFDGKREATKKRARKFVYVSLCERASAKPES